MSSITIAEKFLENLKRKGFLSESLKISFAEVANDTTVFALRNGTTTTFLHNIHVISTCSTITHLYGVLEQR